MSPPCSGNDQFVFPFAQGKTARRQRQCVPELISRTLCISDPQFTYISRRIIGKYLKISEGISLTGCLRVLLRHQEVPAHCLDFSVCKMKRPDLFLRFLIQCALPHRNIWILFTSQHLRGASCHSAARLVKRRPRAGISIHKHCIIGFLHCPDVFFITGSELICSPALFHLISCKIIFRKHFVLSIAQLLIDLSANHNSLGFQSLYIRILRHLSCQNSSQIFCPVHFFYILFFPVFRDPDSDVKRSSPVFRCHIHSIYKDRDNIRKQDQDN